jgi:hypothetical protein
MQMTEGALLLWPFQNPDDGDVEDAREAATQRYITYS